MTPSTSIEPIYVYCILLPADLVFMNAVSTYFLNENVYFLNLTDIANHPQVILQRDHGDIAT